MRYKNYSFYLYLKYNLVHMDKTYLFNCKSI